MTNQIKLLGTTGSTCSRSVLLTAAFLDLDVQVVNVDMNTGEHKKSDHLKLQPFGKVPVLIDTDGTTIFESRAISRYLVLKYGKGHSSLFTVTDLKQFAMIEQWISAESANFYPSISGLVTEAYFKPVFFGMSLDKAELNKYREQIKPTLAVYEEHLKTSKFLVGDKMTLADIFHLPMTFYAFKSGNGDVFDGYPRVKNWIEGMFDQEKVKKVLNAA